MPRQTLTTTQSVGPNPTTGAVVTMTAADTTNFEQVPLTGRELIVVQNTGGAGYTYTITSTPDPFGRSGDISAVSIAAGAIHVLGPFGLDGWRQSNNMLYMQASNAAVKWGVIKLP